MEIASDLAEVVAALVREQPLPLAEPAAEVAPATPAVDLADVRGQEQARRALVVAAAGGHGMLLRGAPGAGKTLLARALPGLLPPLAEGEAAEVLRIHSAAGRLVSHEEGLRDRPFRAPHHSASRAGLLGGGAPPCPGEVTLAHRGVLFLDELPEFDRGALESLRQVLEEGRIVLSRAAARVVFPAAFQLIAAANPCPCGWYGSGVRDCRCDDGVIARYMQRVSGPLLDRIDLHLDVRPVPFSDLDGSPSATASGEARARVADARAVQHERLEAHGVRTNAAIPAGLVHRIVRPTPAARGLLRSAAERLGLSARGAHRALRVARTIADLAGEERVEEAAMAEAVAYRADG